MSGGVDSSVAALLLHRSAAVLQGMFMKNWNEPLQDGACRWEDDVADALAVCDALGIPINTVDFSREYWDEVFVHFLRELELGRTPNPDVLCNRQVKFKSFLDHARSLGAERIATGHYARVDERDGRWRLLRGRDPGKDQSYFLYTLGQAQLRATLFPIGALHKRQVRALAREAGLPVHDKKDSTGICFIGEQPFRAFLARYIPARPGAIRTLDGREIGAHQGVFFYTLGQRRGLAIGGVRGAGEAPWFVVGKDVAANDLFVAQGHDHPALMSRALAAEAPSWTAGRAPAAGSACTARTRYRQADEPCTITRVEAGGFELCFDRPQRAVTPGQSVVLYDGEECLGGGVIARADPAGRH
ncbi:MAG: tRNA 2-thiouridine(34) synthase MnmA [Gammaproteobacteria bacterium]